VVAFLAPNFQQSIQSGGGRDFGHFCRSMSAQMLMVCTVVIALGITFCSYKKLAIFTTNVDAENQTLIIHKCVCGALIRQFFVGAVSGSCFSRHFVFNE